jgi:hypothetical protein
MRKHLPSFTLSSICILLGACGSGDDPSTNDAGGSGSIAGAGSSSTAGQSSGGRSAGGAGAGGSAGSGGAANSSGGAGDGGSASSDGGAAGAGGSSENTSGAVTALTGTLGDLGSVKPTVSTLVIANSGEVLIYMSSAPITCALLSESRWLGSVDAGSQVVEIVVPASRTTGTIPVEEGGAEVNYAPGGMSSAYEESADSGSVTFTKFAANGVAEGTVEATYGSPAGNVAGTFHAEFCDGGQGY